MYNDDGSLALDREEFPRPGTTMESLAELNTVFNLFMDAPIDNSGETFDQLVRNAQIAINQRYHAGNSSGVVDGAAALIMSTKDCTDWWLETGPGRLWQLWAEIQL